jgi:hypothetical protein
MVIGALGAKPAATDAQHLANDKWVSPILDDLHLQLGRGHAGAILVLLALLIGELSFGLFRALFLVLI